MRVCVWRAPAQKNLKKGSRGERGGGWFGRRTEGNMEGCASSKGRHLRGLFVG